MKRKKIYIVIFILVLIALFIFLGLFWKKQNFSKKEKRGYDFVDSLDKGGVATGVDSNTGFQVIER